MDFSFHSLEFLNADMAMMGWSPGLYWSFILANLLIALRYFWLGFHHFASAGDSQSHVSLAHLQYGAFILFCGFSHFAMSLHMLWTSIMFLTIAHWITVFATYWGMFHKVKQT